MNTLLDKTIHKYQKMTDNIRWHLETNKPTDKIEVQKCNQQIEDYQQMIRDLNGVVQAAHPAPANQAALKEAISVIKFWYEFAGNKDWDVYNTHSPEMKRLNAAVADLVPGS